MSVNNINSGRDLDATSDAIDEGQKIAFHLIMSIALTSSFLSVNVLKGKMWDDKPEFVESKDKSQFRDYDSACDRVKNFYKEQHGTFPSQKLKHSDSYSYHTEKQTVAYNVKARVEFKSRKRARMGVWEAIEMLNTLVDDSDPDVSHHLQCHMILSLMAIDLIDQHVPNRPSPTDGRSHSKRWETGVDAGLHYF